MELHAGRQSILPYIQNCFTKKFNIRGTHCHGNTQMLSYEYDEENQTAAFGFVFADTNLQYGSMVKKRRLG